MKHAFMFSCLLLLLIGCDSNKDDLQQYIAQIKQSPVNQLAPLPKPAEFAHIPFDVAQLRSPFGEASQSDPQSIENNQCQVNLPPRVSEPLEEFGLSTLKVMGSIKVSGELNVLILAPNAKIYRVSLGQYLGLNQGRVISLDETLMTIEERIADAEGCLQPRITSMALNLED